MPISCQLRFTYPNPTMAQQLATAIGVDDCAGIVTLREDRTVVCDITTETIQSLLHTLNDLLPCVQLAESVRSGNGPS